VSPCPFFTLQPGHQCQAKAMHSFLQKTPYGRSLKMSM
jgi:hypothetical protein